MKTSSPPSFSSRTLATRRPHAVRDRSVPTTFAPPPIELSEADLFDIDFDWDSEGPKVIRI